MAANNSSNLQPLLMSQSEKTFFTIGLVIVSVLALFGNALVILAFYAYRPLRSYTNYFIVSLSISDILVALTSIPIMITFILSDMNPGLLDGKLLQVWMCIDIMMGVASIFNLTAVSVDRFIHITKPLAHCSMIKRSNVLAAILTIWVFSFVIALVKGAFYDFWMEHYPSYETMIVLIGFIIPLIIIIYCYIRIYGAVQNQVEKFMKQTKCLTNETNVKTDVKAIKTIAIVVLAFFLCWCLFFVLNMYMGWCYYFKGQGKQECMPNRKLISAAKWLHYANSSLNPIIYACFNREFRKGFQIALYKRLSSSQTNSNSRLTSLIKRVSIRSMVYEQTPHASLVDEKLRRKTIGEYPLGMIPRDSIVQCNLQNGGSYASVITGSGKSLKVPDSI